MASANVEIVRGAIEENRSDDLEARMESIVALWDPGCEFISVMAAVEPQTYRGHEGIRRYIRDLADVWEEWRNEVEEVFDVGSDTVFFTSRSTVVGKGSRVAVEARLSGIAVLSDGKLVRGHVYASREGALEAAGLHERRE